MDYADLRVLEAVARQGSMNRAAAELHTVQSNVTARIRALEEQLGTTLFERSSRGVALTPAGERLLPYAARLAALLKEAQEAARDDGTPRGELRIGSLETTAALRLPPILSAFARAHPAVGLMVTTGTTGGLIAEVLENRLDGAFVAGPVSHADLLQDAIIREELMLVTAPGVGRPADLDRHRGLKIIVFRRGCSYRQRLEDLLARRGVQTAQTLESARSRPSWAASRPGSASRSCPEPWSRARPGRGGSPPTSCRPSRRASTPSSSAAARGACRARSRPFSRPHAPRR